MLSQDVDVKNRILKLIYECRNIFYGWRSVFQETWSLRNFKEEDTKTKLIFPLFEILGWNIRDPRETEMESRDYDPNVVEELREKYSSLYSEKYINQSIKVDCIFKVNNKPHVFLEAKHLSQGRLPSLDTLDGQRTVAYAKKWGSKYVVFTNFLKMYIIDCQATPVVFETFTNMSQYISKYDKLKVLLKPDAQEDTSWKRKPDVCFENFQGKPKCDTCDKIERSICEAITKLKHLDTSFNLGRNQSVRA